MANLTATADSNFQWWTHSVQSGTLEHSGAQVAMEKMEKAWGGSHSGGRSRLLVYNVAYLLLSKKRFGAIHILKRMLGRNLGLVTCYILILSMFNHSYPCGLPVDCYSCSHKPTRISWTMAGSIVTHELRKGMGFERCMSPSPMLHAAI